jgi:hypothetical protein
LTTAELQYALAVKPGTTNLDGDFMPESEEIVSACAGLVTIDEQRGIVRWIHYTTQEYFERMWAQWVPDRQQNIATACLTSLLFCDFASGFSPTDESFGKRLTTHTLYDYAARNWGHHAIEAEISEVLQSAILSLLTNESKMSASCQALFADRSYGGYSQRFPRNVTGIHRAAYFGLSDVISTLISKGYDRDIKDSVKLTPLA